MKQINGTITLSFLEEDNQQRVIFRVVPLCTREGVVFRDKSVDFPDQGSLRIVPDKREQSTFKERMRSMGSLCAIQLCNEGKELAKVRQNRNYDPGQGESNQFAIYSDVICEFSENGVFEVFDEGVNQTGALSQQVLLRRGMVLYGPVNRETAPDWTTLKPFGNDSYLLQTVELADGQERSFYWNPEQTITWRQRRSTLRRGKPSLDEADSEADDQLPIPETPRLEPSHTVDEITTERQTCAQPDRVSVAEDRPITPLPAPARKLAQAEQVAVAQEKPTAVEPTAEQPQPVSEAPAYVARPERRREKIGDTTLPIGKRLSILDGSITFEEQISKLDQPLSDAANLLIGATSDVSGDGLQTTARFNGTPLVHVTAKTVQPVHHGEALHYVVERQVRAAHRENGDQNSDFKHVENPIENLHVALDKAWQTPETRQLAIQCLCDNEAFTQQFLRQLQQQGREMRAVDAAQEQLEDIEADRLSLLMQLETVKTDHRRAMETLCAEMNQKKREEVTRLDNQIRAAKAELESLNETITAMGDEVKRHTMEWLAESQLQLCASAGDTISLVPTVGVRRGAAEMIAAIRIAMNRQGFACNEDDATELLLHFALNNEFCLCGDSIPEAELCARTMLEGLGLAGVSARTRENTRLEVASFLPTNGLRTPTVELCSMSRPAINPYGHKIIRLMEARAPMHAETSLPIVYAPMLRTNLRENRPCETQCPTALDSFIALRDEVKPLLTQGENWFSELESKLMEQGSQLAGSTTQQMRVFVSIASSRLRGGFLAAADAAVLGWVVPAVCRRELNPEPLRTSIASLPRCLSALGIQ